MKRLIYVILITSLFVLPFAAYAQTGDADKEVARTQEFIEATTKSGAAKITALKAYIQKFPESSSKWTILAYYNLAIEYFRIEDYAQAIQTGEKTLKMSLGEGEHARLLLVIANSYGVKKSPLFNQDKALEYVQKAIDYAQSKDQQDVVSEAGSLKAKLAGPPPKKMTPEQQIKYHVSNADYASAVSYYQGLGASDKGNEEIHKTYAFALFKGNKLDQALTEYQALLAKHKRASYAHKIAEVYSDKAKKNKQFTDSAVDAYLEAYLLFQKEGNAENSKKALDLAQFQVYEKYGLNDKIKKYNASLGNQQDSSKKNEAEIARLERDLRKEQRRIQKEYERQDLEPPAYELDKITKLEAQIEKLRSGGGSSASSKASDEGKKLDEELKRVKTELDGLIAKAKKKLGL